MISYLEKIGGYIPLASVVLFFLAVVRIYVFYDSFDVDIIPLLTISEVLKSMLNTLIPFVIFVLWFLIYYIEKYNTLELNEIIANNNIPPTIRTLEQSHMARYYLLGNNVITLFMLFVLFSRMKWIAFSREMWYYGIFLIAIASIFSIVLLMRLTKDDFDNLKGINIKLENIVIISVASLLISTFSLFGLLEAIFVRNKGGRQTHIEFRFNDKIIKSDSTNLYIGIIENFVILHNTSNKSSNLYRTSEIKELAFVDKRNAEVKKVKTKSDQIKPSQTPRKDSLLTTKKDTVKMINK